MKEKKPNPNARPSEIALVPAAGNTASNSARTRQLMHGRIAPAAVYANALTPRLLYVLDELERPGEAMDYAKTLIEKMNPRDPAEEMLVAQMLMAHVRVLHLTDIANKQETLNAIRTVNECADRASNTYRRLMLGLAEYRRPPRASDSFTAIRQANIAGQQVIQNHENAQPKNATNEQGSGAPSRLPEGPAAISVDTGRAGFAENDRCQGEALGTINGAKNEHRKGPRPAKRDEAR